MKENRANFDSLGISEDTEIKKSYKPYTFSMGDNIKNIRNLVIQMSRLPLAKREQHDSQR
jgi:hypothetical protein